MPIKIKDTNNTSRILEAMYRGVDRGLAVSGRFLRDEIKPITPVDTGKLQKSMRTDRKSGNTQTVSTDVEYAKYMEFGTIHIAPRAMMRKAFDSNVANMTRIFVQEINKFIGKVK